MRRSIPWPSLTIFLLSCGSPRPDIPRPPPIVPQLTFEPDCLPDQVPSVVRIRLWAPGTALPQDAALFSGSVGSRDLRDLAAGRAAESLRKRQVGLLTWTDEDALIVAPTVRLDADQHYCIAVPSWSWSSSFRVRAFDDAPYLERVWPPADEPGNGSVGVWCLSQPARGWVEEIWSDTRLLPAGVDGKLVSGAISSTGQGCVRWLGPAVEGGALVMAPPVVLLEDGREARVDPRPLGGGAPSVLSETLCPSPSIELGPVCATVLDDRIRLEQPAGARWVGVSVDDLRWASLVGPGSPAVLRPLPIDSWVELSVHALDGNAMQHDWWMRVRTKAVMAHLVLSEVMANPVGPEPEQEWLELFNDGVEPVQLNHWILQDSGGETRLPECVLQPGQFALVVNEAYDTESWVDRPPAPGTHILRVEQLGMGGLSNSGEAVRIVAEGGEGVSLIPPIASPKQGVSIARRAMDLPDSLVGSFMDGPNGGTPGAHNAD